MKTVSSLLIAQQKQQLEESIATASAENTIFKIMVDTPQWEQKVWEQWKRLETISPSKNEYPLWGVPVGVKDMIRVAGWETRCGSQLPPECFQGNESPVVKRLKAAGAIIFGKTTTAEFAGPQAGPARNPYSAEHSAGNSSGGSAAGVAKGLFPLALGTQTVGSVITPAGFCGVRGYKPSYQRVSNEGCIQVSPQTDQLGFFAKTWDWLETAIQLVDITWKRLPQPPNKKWRIGIPLGPYLDELDREIDKAFNSALDLFQEQGSELVKIDMLADIGDLTNHYRKQIAFELSRVHQPWFVSYADRYAPKTRTVIERGGRMTDDEGKQLFQKRLETFNTLETLRCQYKVDVWVAPATPRPAPVKSDDRSEDCNLNLPWSYVGLPMISYPIGWSEKQLPLSLQAIGGFNQDETLLAFGKQTSSWFADNSSL